MEGLGNTTAENRTSYVPSVSCKLKVQIIIHKQQMCIDVVWSWHNDFLPQEYMPGLNQVHCKPMAVNI